MKTEILQKDLQEHISSVIKNLFPTSEFPVIIDIPTNKSKADLVINVAFSIAKQIKKHPVLVAEDIVNKLKEIESLKDFFSFSYASAGFINILVSNKFINILIEDVIKNKNVYGTSNILSGQTWVIEHTSPNPNKAMHVGHLRNNLIGSTIAHICKMCGAEVIQDAVDNDRGIAIAKAMWGFLVFKKKDDKRITDVTYWSAHEDEWLSPEGVSLKADHFVGECYALGSEDFKINPQSEKLIRDFVVRWENHDQDIWKLWKKIIDYAHEGIENTLTKLNNKWDKVWPEHEHYSLGKCLVQEGIKKSIFKKLENGAVLTNLSQYCLPDTILLKSDGTSLYITQDIALTKLKKEFYHADKFIWVIGPEQSTAMKQVFATCEQLGIGKIKDFVHVPYGLVKIVDESGNVKKMSSRGGEAVLIDDFIDEVKNILLQTGRGYSNQAAEDIALGAIRYSLLRISRVSDVVIDVKSSTDLKGDSGIYILYTYSRMRSLLSKVAIDYNKQIFSFEDQEKKIVLELLYFPMIIQNCLLDYSPNIIVEYLFKLAQSFNTLYSCERFITNDQVETNKKIALTKALSIVFEITLGIIGIKAPERV